MIVRPLRAVLVAAAALLALTACSAQEPAASEAPESAVRTVADVLSEEGWADLSGAELITTLDQLPLEQRPTDLIASVKRDVVTLTGTGGDTATVPVDDGFYLSIAPYISQTHPCGFHSLTTCTGEMQDEAFTLTAVDTATGETIVDEQVTTYANGFVGVWLPADTSVEITVTGAEGTATTTVTTGADDPTCLTTLQLSPA